MSWTVTLGCQKISHIRSNRNLTTLKHKNNIGGGSGNWTQVTLFHDLRLWCIMENVCGKKSIAASILLPYSPLQILFRYSINICVHRLNCTNIWQSWIALPIQIEPYIFYYKLYIYNLAWLTKYFSLNLNHKLHVCSYFKSVLWVNTSELTTNIMDRLEQRPGYRSCFADSLLLLFFFNSNEQLNSLTTDFESTMYIFLKVRAE